MNDKLLAQVASRPYLSSRELDGGLRSSPTELACVHF